MSAVQRMLNQEQFDALFGKAIASLETWQLQDALQLMEEAVVIRLGKVGDSKARKRNKRRQRRRLLVGPMVSERKRLKQAVKRVQRESRDTKTSYREYLESDEWRGIRLRILTRDSHTCVACGNKASAVHHRDYHKQTMLGKRLHKLVSICCECHEHIHFVSGEKVSVEIVDIRLHELIIHHDRRCFLPDRVLKDFDTIFT